MKQRNHMKENAEHFGTQFGAFVSKNAQSGTKAAIDGMSLFKAKGLKLQNVGYEQAKGNLFEFIEAAKVQHLSINSRLQMCPNQKVVLEGTPLLMIFA